jgi:3-oxo-5-alpha-steroid 4-dehydrogenase 1
MVRHVNEAMLVRALSLGLMAAAAVIFVALLFVTAPYGRHARRGWGPAVSARLGWILMEGPASLGFAGVYLAGESRSALAPLALLGLWELHYLQRAFVFPFRMRIADRPMPLSIIALGATFNLLNAYLNARWISSLGHYPASWLLGPRFELGFVLFLAGYAANRHSDRVLAKLREGGRSGYFIPQDGLFRFVSCPNYLGEIVEWAGFALASSSLPALAFALFTTANLAPRALAHHRWYRTRFPDYPPTRRALIPYVW